MKNNVIIVGSGVNGLMCAYYLVKHGSVEIKIYDQAPIPNLASASSGKHRLIHPWCSDGNAKITQKALSALLLWQDILNDIVSDSFEQTGVVAVAENNFSFKYDHYIDVNLLSTKDVSEIMPLLENFGSGYVHHFPQFGVLFADKILNDLVHYLQKNSVQFYEKHSVVSIDAQMGNIYFSDGKVVIGDKIIIAAGYGANSIVSSSFKKGEYSLPSFRPMKCYVVYVKHQEMKIHRTVPAWASLGVGDMWGIPPLRSIPMKLGCGDFTKPCDSLAVDDSTTIAQKIIDRYKQLFPKFDGLEFEAVGINHWTKIENDNDYIKTDKTVFVTSDNGAGFKFAPFVAKNIVQELL